MFILFGAVALLLSFKDCTPAEKEFIEQHRTSGNGEWREQN